MQIRDLQIVGLALLLCGCSAVNVTVGSYSTLPGGQQSGKLAVMGNPAAIEDSPEFKGYKKTFETQFAEQGFEITDDINHADYVAFVNYGIGEGETKTRSYTNPVYGAVGEGVTPQGGATASDAIMANRSGEAYKPGGSAVVAYDTKTTSHTVYTGHLNVDMFEMDKSGLGEKVFEAKLLSKGTCGRLEAVMDEWIGALFLDFPDTNGKQQIQGDLDCR